MITLLILYSIVVTILMIITYFKPSLELKLVQDGIYNYYTLYLYFSIKNNDDVTYKSIKLFSYKTKNNDKRGT